MICKFCAKICKNKNSLINHERLCKQNPDRKMPKKTKAWYDAMAKNKANQYIKAKRLGLPKPELSEETLKKKSESAKRTSNWTEERRKNHSEIMKGVVEKHRDSYTKNNVCGRVKQVEYNGVLLKGQWELKLAQWLDSHNIKWEYEPEGFPYSWKNNTKIYFPDFFIPCYDYYIEVKGYKTERDESKWKAFPKNLSIANASNIDKLDEFNTVEEFLTLNKFSSPCSSDG